MYLLSLVKSYSTLSVFVRWRCQTQLLLCGLSGRFDLRRLVTERYVDATLL
jgi:hypothetical protein